MGDPVVDEIQGFRHDHAATFNFDLDAIFEDYKRLELESGRTYVSFPPRRVVARFIESGAGGVETNSPTSTSVSLVPA